VPKKGKAVSYLSWAVSTETAKYELGRGLLASPKNDWAVSNRAQKGALKLQPKPQSKC
jgi:hypothetical protein